MAKLLTLSRIPATHTVDQVANDLVALGVVRFVQTF